MSDQPLLTEKKGHVLIVTLNRPDKKNAVNAQVLCGLYDAWQELDNNKEIRVAILTGAGKDFCSGMDLTVVKKLTSGTPPENEYEERMMGPGDIIFGGWLKTYRPTKPVIAAVEGYALAGGTEILLGTDIRVAGESAQFGITEAKRGLFPMAGSSIRVPRQIGYTRAVEMLLTGNSYSAKECKEMGLIGHVVPDGTAMEKAMEIAESIAENGPLSVQALLKVIREVATLPEEKDFEQEFAIGIPVFSSKDAKEGPKAFLEKRKPNFSGE